LRSSNTWVQIIADILGRELLLVEAPEASLRGAVLLALESLGNIENIEEILPGRGTIFGPSADQHAAHNVARKRQRAVYDLIMSNH
jgi:gluconokinase